VPGGYLDDAAVLAWVIRTIHEELNAFIKWEMGAEG